MVPFMVFLAVYFIACASFLVVLVRWTLRSERRCACGGSLGSGSVDILHGQQMCYPAREALKFG
jgi:hypothetical protein